VSKQSRNLKKATKYPKGYKISMGGVTRKNVPKKNIKTAPTEKDATRKHYIAQKIGRPPVWDSGSWQSVTKRL